MAFEIKMPLVGVMMDTGVITVWNKNEGDKVEKGDVLAEMETDKMSSPIEAAGSGILLKILAPEGSELPPGAVLGYIGQPGENIVETVETDSVSAAGTSGEEAGENGRQADATGKEASQAATPWKASKANGPAGPVRISPLAKKIAKENGLDYTALQGSGPKGRIVAKDIRESLTMFAKGAPQAAAFMAHTAEDTFIPFAGMRKAIGENMAKSWSLAPMVTHFASVDASEMQMVRKRFNQDAVEEKKASVIGFLVLAAAKTLERYPAANASLEGIRIRRHGAVNIGVAVASERGLLVPAVKDANRKSLLQISAEIRELSDRARNNKLTPDDLCGGTFTISSVGSYRSVEHFTPIINQPESAILGVGRTVETPVVLGGEIVARPMMPLSLTFDHRVLDGAPAAEFLRLLMDVIENPIKFLM